MRLGELGRAQKLVLLFGLLMALIIVGIVWAVRASRRNIGKLESQLAAAEKTYEDTKALAERLPDLKRELTMLGVELQYLGCLAWGEPEYMPALVRALSDLAIRDRISLKAVKPMLGAPGPPQAEAGPVLATRKLTIVVAGSYAGIYRFVNDLQRFPVLLALKDVRVGITSPEGPEGLPILDATLTTDMSVLPQVKPVKEVDIFGTQPEETAPVVGGPGAGPSGGGGAVPAPIGTPSEDATQAL